MTESSITERGAGTGRYPSSYLGNCWRFLGESGWFDFYVYHSARSFLHLPSGNTTTQLLETVYLPPDF